MFNHIRTLLLNNVNAPTLGEVAQPPEFRMVTLPPVLVAVRARLFGSNPDRAMLNYRLAQLMPLIATTELQEYVLAPDQRLTYTAAGTTDLFSATAFTPTPVTAYGGDLVVGGTPNGPEPTGRLLQDFVVTATETQVTVEGTAPSSWAQTWTPTAGAGLFPPVDLGNSGYTVTAPAAPGAWSLTFYLRPQWTLGQVGAVLHVLSPAVLTALFGTAAAEPYQTFSNCFYNHPQLAYQLGGLALALAYRTDEARQGVYSG